MSRTKINLLPWREEKRKKQKQDFLSLLVLAALVGGLVWWLWQAAIQTDIDYQNERNRTIQTTITSLDRKIKEIEDVDRRRNDLIERMRVIQDLQGKRPSVVYVFEELVRVLPENVYFTDIKRSGNAFTIVGIAQTNNNISELMRNMTASPWFGEPILGQVTAVGNDNQANRFTLTVQQQSPDAKELEQ
ncbi:MAG TPA: PilN domain-containing protein [Alcanivoracaceae bacterium]|nr:PilN domain-containing protein [Alcanivoracaceae bacterium]